MKNYAIYSICGMPWHQSTGISVIATYILTTINFGIVQFGVCIGVALIYSIISALLPSLIINGTSIKEILRNNE